MIVVLESLMDAAVMWYSNPPPLAFPPSLASCCNNIVNSPHLDIILVDMFSRYVELHNGWSNISNLPLAKVAMLCFVAEISLFCTWHTQIIFLAHLDFID
jgi:hypothetical protein